MVQCSSCGKNAIIQIGINYFCVECIAEWVQMHTSLIVLQIDN